MSLEMPSELNWLFVLAAGESWPKGDEDGLRALGSAWLTASSNIVGLTTELDTVTLGVEGAIEGTPTAAFHDLVGALRDNFEPLGQGAEQLGTSAWDYAAQVEYTKYMIIAQLIILAAEIAWAYAWGPVTAGATEAMIPGFIAACRAICKKISESLVLRLLTHAATGALAGGLVDALIQGIQMLNGDRTHWDAGLTANAFIGGAAGGLLGGGLGNLLKKLPGLSPGSLSKIVSKADDHMSDLPDLGNLSKKLDNLRHGFDPHIKTPHIETPDPKLVHHSGRGPDQKYCKSDPVDLVSGEVVLVERDLGGPDAPGLRLTRTHLSSYRAGGVFGPSWASTLDQRLERDDGVLFLLDEQARILAYPPPAPGEVSWPVEGPRWPLRALDDGGHAATRDDGTVLRFAPAGPGPAQPLAELREPTGAVTRVERDALGRPAALVHRVGEHSAGVRAELELADGRVVAVRLAPEGEAPAGEPVLRYTHGPHGPVEVLDHAGRPATYSYDERGRVTGWVDRIGRWYRYTYDAAGRCVATAGEGGVQDGAFAYDPARRVTTYVDAHGDTTEIAYNERGQVVRETDAAGHSTLTERDRYDRVIARTDPLGRTTTTEYAEDPDGADGGPGGRTVRPDGSVVAIPTGPVGSPPPARAVPAAPPVAQEWSVDGLLLARHHSGGGEERWEHDAEGNVVAHLDPAGRATRQEYSAAGLCTATVAPDGARTEYGWDRERRLVSVAAPGGLRWRFEYDGAGRLVAQTDYDGRRSTYGYDAAGQLVRSVDASGAVVTYAYDVLGRMTERTTAEGTTTYGYDALDHLAWATSPDSTLEIERDERDRVVAATVDGRRTTFTYRGEGPGYTVTRRTPSGCESSWAWGTDGRVEALVTGGHVVGFTHDADGRETARALDGDPVLRQEHDPAGRLWAQDMTTARGVHRRAVERHADGRVAAIDDDVAGRRALSLDPAGRVAAVSAPGGAEEYRYDALGNVVAADGREHRYTGTMLVDAGGVRYGYDTLGRLVRRTEPGPDGEDRRWHYTWDAHGRLVGVVTPDGERWRYRYDPFGRRTAKERLDGDGAVVESVRFTWDGTELIEAERVGVDSAVRVTSWEHHPDDGRVVVQYETVLDTQGVDDGFRLVVTDELGTPVLLRDASGRVYGAGGTLWSGGGAAETPLRFPGQYHDAETGLHHNVYRYYDPATARYLSPDPLGLEPALNPVAYVPNPTVECDPLGLTGCGGSSGGGAPPRRPGNPGGGGDRDHSKDTGSGPGDKRDRSPDSDDPPENKAPKPDLKYRHGGETHAEWKGLEHKYTKEMGVPPNPLADKDKQLEHPATSKAARGDHPRGKGPGARVTGDMPATVRPKDEHRAHPATGSSKSAKAEQQKQRDQLLGDDPGSVFKENTAGYHGPGKDNSNTPAHRASNKQAQSAVNRHGKLPRLDKGGNPSSTHEMTPKEKAEFYNEHHRQIQEESPDPETKDHYKEKAEKGETPSPPPPPGSPHGN